MGDQSHPEIYSQTWEQHLHDMEATLSGMALFFDTTSINVFNGVEVSTGVTSTGTIVNLDKYESVMFYVDSSSVTTVAAGMTGLEVEFFLRPTSGSPWASIGLQSGIAAEDTTWMKVVGTGGFASGVVPIRDLKILVTNRSGSATATLNAFVVAKGS